MVLPRRVTRHFRLTAWFYRRTWLPWKAIAKRIATASRQQSFLGYFGPLSLIMLLAFWAMTLIVGFALLQYGIGGHEQLSGEPITFGRISTTVARRFSPWAMETFCPLRGWRGRYRWSKQGWDSRFSAW